MKKENKRNLSQELAEKLKEVGARLHQHRTEKSISIEEVATKTRIQTRLLRAIEEGRLDELPEPIYIQGFVRRFAEAIGLNGNDFASDFPVAMNVQVARPTWQYVRVAQLRPFHLYFLYIFLVIGSVNGLSYVVSRSNVQVIKIEDASNQTKKFQSNSKQFNSQLNIELKPSNPGKPSSPGNKPVQVGVTLKASSWIRIVADGKPVFEGTLPEGTQRTWVADDKLVVRAGNAGGVLVEFNNQIAKQMGAPGKVEEITFAAKPGS